VVGSTIADGLGDISVAAELGCSHVAVIT